MYPINKNITKYEIPLNMCDFCPNLFLNTNNNVISNIITAINPKNNIGPSDKEIHSGLRYANTDKNTVIHNVVNIALATTPLSDVMYML